ncbi:hypothetical protein [Vogesella oryzae]|uniref:hypothetical protein n=1 Tax=Vogesella oryzae TaxID=1735285 RepID=UPI0015829BB2|nr:hypothetical protein [Vogesella oryzae]
MPQISVSVWVDEEDVLEEIDTESLLKELQRRKVQMAGFDSEQSLRQTADQFRWYLAAGNHAAALELARTTLEDATGRILN